MAMLFALVIITLTTLLLPIVVGQARATGMEMSRDHARQAAEAGLDAAMAQIRAADNGAGIGVRASMPCGPLTGTVGGGGGSATYTVSIHYVASDPKSHMNRDPSWFATAANHLACTAGSGPASVPQYAVFYATGTAAGFNRLVRAAYRVRTSNQNILGGQIHIFPMAPTARALCLDAVNLTTVAPGTKLQMLDCDTTGTRLEQIFAYTPSSTLMLVNSVTGARPLGLCLDAGPIPHVSGAFVVFQLCQSPAPVRQQWQFNGNAQFEGVSSGTTTDGYVFQLQTADTPGTLTMTSSPVWDGNYNDINSFLVDPAVGPGNAGPQNNQLVNFNRFGQCLDLIGGDYTAGYLIVWQCKPAWNQGYNLPPVSTSITNATAGTINMVVAAGSGSTKTPPGTYCLQGPRSTALWTYPKLVTCAAGSATANLQWRVYGYTGDYATSFRIQDIDGNCLQAADPDATPSDTDNYGTLKISRIEVRACTDSTLQKWNADPNVTAGLPLKYIGEN